MAQGAGPLLRHLTLQGHWVPQILAPPVISIHHSNGLMLPLGKLVYILGVGVGVGKEAVPVATMAMQVIFTASH